MLLGCVCMCMHMPCVAWFSDHPPCACDASCVPHPCTSSTTGRPKTITGFQTHTTPVLLSAGERAELGTEKYLSLSPVLEGVVILKKNPDYVEKHE